MAGWKKQKKTAIQWIHFPKISVAFGRNPKFSGIDENPVDFDFTERTLIHLIVLKKSALQRRAFKG